MFSNKWDFTLSRILLKFSKLHLQLLLLVKFTSSFRLFGIIIQAISGTVGNLILYLVVYFVRHWVHLHLAAGILSLLSLPSFLIIPESPRCTMILLRLPLNCGQIYV